MFHFQGLAQVLSREPQRGNDGRYRRDVFKLICNRGAGESPPYNGNPFDVYKLILNYTDQQLEAAAKIKAGDIVWIANGNVISNCRRYPDGREFWNAVLTVDLKDVVSMGWQKPGPDYVPHIRTGINSRKFMG